MAEKNGQELEEDIPREPVPTTEPKGLANSEEILSLEQNPVKEETSDLRSIIILFFMYLVQSTTKAFFQDTIPLLLMEKKATPKELGILSFVQYPFSLKLFIAPITDIYFFPNFGRKKSWIVPSQYLLVILLFIMSFSIEGLIEGHNTTAITWVGIILFCALAIQDVALDSWLISITRPENYSWGSTCLFLADIIGNLIGFNMVIHFGDLDFCNEHIFSSRGTEPILTTKSFLMWYSAASLVLTLILHFFQKEKTRIAPPEEPRSLKSMFSSLLKGTWANTTLLVFMAFLFARVWGFAPLGHQVNNFRFVSKGLKKERISEYIFFTVPFTVGFGLFIPKTIVRYGHELKAYIASVCFLFIETILWFVLIAKFEAGLLDAEHIKPYFIALYTLSSFAESLRIVGYSSYVTRIADDRASSTFVTLMHVVTNLGSLFSSTAVLFSMGFVSPSILAYGGWAIGLGYIMMAFKFLLPMERLDRESFRITSKEIGQLPEDNEVGRNM